MWADSGSTGIWWLEPLATFVGALVGAAIAVGGAFWVANHQLHRERTHAQEDRARATESRGRAIAAELHMLLTSIRYELSARKSNPRVIWTAAPEEARVLNSALPHVGDFESAIAYDLVRALNALGLVRGARALLALHDAPRDGPWSSREGEVRRMFRDKAAQELLDHLVGASRVLHAAGEALDGRFPPAERRDWNVQSLVDTIIGEPLP